MAAVYRWAYLNHNTALLKLQGYQHVTPSLFPDTCTTNKMCAMKIILGILHSNTPKPTKKITEKLICKGWEKEESLLLPLPIQVDHFQWDAHEAAGSQGGSEGQLPFGVSGASHGCNPQFPNWAKLMPVSLAVATVGSIIRICFLNDLSACKSESC